MTRANRTWIALAAIALAFALPYAARGGLTQSGSAQGKVAAVPPLPAHATGGATLGAARDLPRAVVALPPPPPPPPPRRPARVRSPRPTVVTTPAPAVIAPSPAPVVTPTPAPAPAPTPAPRPAPRPAPTPKQFSSSG